MQRHPFKPQLLAAMRTLLRPVVRQLIAHGVSFPAFAGAAKELFVEVAERDFPLPFKRQTDSRLALVTGLNRKEVATLRGRRPARARSRELEEDILTHVIGRWMAGPPYATANGTPLQLPYEAEATAAPSFTRLVRELNVDLPVRALLDELIRTDSVTLLPNGDVILQQQGRIVATDVEAKVALLGSEPAELFSTIARNIEQPERPWLQRKVVYDNVGAEALAALEAEARRLGEEFIRRANVLLATYDRDRNAGAPGGARTRVVLGAYYFAEPTDDATPAPPRSPKSEAAPVPPGRIRRSK
jgi:hypothetical protein